MYLDYNILRSFLHKIVWNNKSLTAIKQSPFLLEKNRYLKKNADWGEHITSLCLGDWGRDRGNDYNMGRVLPKGKWAKMFWF